ncbi:MAG: quinolinate synthase NadA [Bacteroidales bacterium]|nr:quinolinate synthase NadA [Bacteroidales bacterium]
MNKTNNKFIYKYIIINMLKEEILNLKQKKNALILAHYYQEDAIQEIADYCGDSLALANIAQKSDHSIIVLCGVHFMAETAKILNPTKKVLLPDLQAGCSLADSCKAEDLKKFKEKYPDHKVISYINCTAEVKTLSDLICTSGNALQLIQSFPKDEKIIFAPDKNLGSYINAKLNRNMILWDGSCHVHNRLKTEEILKLKQQNSDALVIAHPECQGVVLALADYVGSTNGMLKFVNNSTAKKFIVATETGILFKMKKENPDKEFLIVPMDEKCSCNDCDYMKLNTLEKLYQCLLTEKPEITLSEEVMQKALKSVEKMLEMSKQLGII